MKFEDVKKKLDEFAEFTIARAKKNLQKEGKGSGALAESLDYEKDVEKDAFIVSFLMEDYGKFVDKGVKGANPSLVKNGDKKHLTVHLATNKRCHLWNHYHYGQKVKI